MSDRRFKEGDEVVVCNSGWHHSISRRSKVAKVYKTGNFLLEDKTKQQWKQSGHQAGDTCWSRDYLLHADSPVVAEIEEEMNKRKLINQFITLADKVARHVRKHEPDPTQLRVARRALQNLLPKEESE